MKTKHQWIYMGALLLSNAFYSLGCGTAEIAALISAGSCSVTDTGSGFTTCFDYTGSGYTSATAQSACSSTTSGSATGTYSSSACTTTGRIGSCVIYSGQASEQTIRYISGYDSTTAPAACSAMSGTYTAG